MQTLAPLRPLDLGDILDGTFRLYRNNFVTFLGIIALVQVPVELLRILFAVTFSPDNDAISEMLRTPGAAQIPGMEWLAVYSAYANSPANSLLNLVSGFVLQPLITLALVYAISRRYLNLPTTIIEAYQSVTGRLLPMIAATLLLGVGAAIVIGLPFACIFIVLIAGVAGLGTAAGGDSAGLAATGIIGSMLALLLILALFVAVLVLSVRLVFYPQTLVIEGQGPIEALTRSWRLVGGLMWRTVGIYLLISILSSVVSVIIAVTFLVLGLLLGVTIGNPMENYGVIVTLFGLVQLLSNLLVQPLLLIGTTLLYYDLRVRKEGLDMELQAMNAPQF